MRAVVALVALALVIVLVVGCGEEELMYNPLDPLANEYIGDKGAAEIYAAMQELEKIAEHNGMMVEIQNWSYKAKKTEVLFEGKQAPQEVREAAEALRVIADGYGVHLYIHIISS